MTCRHLLFIVCFIFIGSIGNGNESTVKKPDGKGGDTLLHHSPLFLPANNSHHKPTPTPTPTPTASATPVPSQAACGTGNGIDYHGGPLILNTTRVYYIWYGNWSGNTAPNILTDFANYYGGSSRYNTNTTYCNGSGGSVSNSVSYSSSVSDNYSRGTNLGDNDIAAIVSSKLSSGALPVDPNAVYFVLTSSDVSESSGFCTKYCGWHSNLYTNGADIKFAFVGDAARCPKACAPQIASPNNNTGADAMASVIAHELEEAVTDSDGNAWYSNATGKENADMCAWTYGNVYTTSNGSYANISLGGRDFLIQQGWVNASGGYCAQGY